MRLYGRIRLNRHLALFTGIGPDVFTVAVLLIGVMALVGWCGR